MEQCKGVYYKLKDPNNPCDDTKSKIKKSECTDISSCKPTYPNCNPNDFTCTGGNADNNCIGRHTLNKGVSACSELGVFPINSTCFDKNCTPSPVDCKGDWEDGNCSPTCGTGTKEQTYKVTQQYANGGKACNYANKEKRSVNCYTKCPSSPSLPQRKNGSGDILYDLGISANGYVDLSNYFVNPSLLTFSLSDDNISSISEKVSLSGASLNITKNDYYGTSYDVKVNVIYNGAPATDVTVRVTEGAYCTWTCVASDKTQYSCMGIKQQNNSAATGCKPIDDAHLECKMDDVCIPSLDCQYSDISGTTSCLTNCLYSGESSGTYEQRLSYTPPNMTPSCAPTRTQYCPSITSACKCTLTSGYYFNPSNPKEAIKITMDTQPDACSGMVTDMQTNIDSRFTIIRNNILKKVDNTTMSIAQFIPIPSPTINTNFPNASIACRTDSVDIDLTNACTSVLPVFYTYMTDNVTVTATNNKMTNVTRSRTNIGGITGGTVTTSHPINCHNLVGATPRSVTVKELNLNHLGTCSLA